MFGASALKNITSKHIFDRKYQDYVYIKWKYWSTIEKIKHYLRHENKVKENKVFYCKALRCEGNRKQQKVVFLYVKLANLLSFYTRFPKSAPTYKRQVVNPRHQTSKGQSVAKPGTPPVEYRRREPKIQFNIQRECPGPGTSRELAFAEPEPLCRTRTT